MQLTEAVTEAVADASDPTAVLALTYAASIDEACHVPLGLADALALLGLAASLADDGGEDRASGDTYTRAFQKVAAALTAVSVSSDLGPKLLATLDALLLTPKARQAIGAKMSGAVPTSPLQRLRERHDSRSLRPVG